MFLPKFCPDTPNTLEIWSFWSFFWCFLHFFLPNVTRLGCFGAFFTELEPKAAISVKKIYVGLNIWTKQGKN